MLDAEEREIMRRVEAGTLSASEEADTRRRLAELALERSQLKIDKMGLEAAELRRRLLAGNLSAEEEAEIRQRLAELEAEVSVIEALPKILDEGIDK